MHSTKNTATHRRVFIAVRGTGPVPFDMLRFDHCAPADEGQAHKMEGCDSIDKERWIILERFVPIGENLTPNVVRWKNFGWHCLPFNCPDFRTVEQMIHEWEERKLRETEAQLSKS